MALSLTVPDTSATTQRNARRVERLEVQQLLWAHSSKDRVRACGARVSSRSEAVAIKHTAGADGSRTAGFSGIQTCGSVWACPECNAKIAAHRADEVTAAASNWLGSGGKILLVTFTVRHHKFSNLRNLFEALSYAWSKTFSGRGWADMQALYGSPVEQKSGGFKVRVPYVKAMETTHGDNGWHPHLHALLFVNGDMTEDMAAQIQKRLHARWSTYVTRKGLDAPSPRHGTDVKLIYPDAKNGVDDAVKYIVKAGWELAGGAGKLAKMGNLTPFGILRRFWKTGDLDDLDLWHTWEKASHGRRQLTWSRGARRLLGLDVDERTDEEIVDDDLGGEIIAWLDPAEFKALRHRKAALLAAAEYLPLAFLRSAPPSLWINEHQHRLTRDRTPAST